MSAAPVPTNQPGESSQGNRSSVVRSKLAPASLPTPAGGDRKMSALVVDDLAALEHHLPAWEGLATASIEPNPFYEPWMLMSAVRHLSAGARLKFVLIYASGSGPSAPMLCGFFPLEVRSAFEGLNSMIPVRTLSLWKHKYCYLCTPLLREQLADEALAAFFDWLDSHEHGCELMDFKFVTGEGPFNHALIDYATRTSRLTLAYDSFTRALFRPRADAEAYFREALSGGRRKELRRLENRLKESGRLEYEALEPDGDEGSWIEGFLKLEAASWKGRQSRALLSSEGEREFFEEAAMEAFNRGRLMMLAVKHNGRAIAHKCNFTAGSGSYAFKIAYDDEYARYSPGVLLEMENIRRLQADSQLEWMDSCADPDHPMIDHLWMDRVVIQSVLVGTGRRIGDLVLSAIPAMKWLHRAIFRRDLLKRRTKLQ